MFKNLAKAHVEKFKKKREEKRDPTIAERRDHYSPLRIYLHSTINIFTSDWILMEGQNNGFIIPNGELSVLAIGKMKLDTNNWWRIYLEDDAGEEYILSMLEGNGEIEDAILFKQIATMTPVSQAQLNRITSQIGFQKLETDGGMEYDREWGDQWTEKLDFYNNEFDEKFISKEEVEDFVNYYILYSRDIKSGEKEWLFVGLEEGEEFGEIAFQTGFSVDVKSIDVQ